MMKLHCKVGLNASVETKAGKVLLRGNAKTAESKAVAGRLAMTTRGVIAVDNQLIVDSKKPTVTDTAKSAVRNAGRSISDSWITAKVKSTICIPVTWLDPRLQSPHAVVL